MDDDVTDVDPYAELDPLRAGHIRVSLSHAALKLDGTAHGLHNTREFRQNPVTGDPDQSPAMFIYLRMQYGVPMGFPFSERALLVRGNEPAVAGYIGGEDRCQPSFYPFAISGRAWTPVRG